MKRIARCLVCAGALVTSSPTAAGGERIDARVQPSYAYAPADVLVRAYIEPDERNRSVEFVLDSGSMFASSTIDLDGDRAPRMKEVTFRRVPAGAYEVRVTLFGKKGEQGSAVRHILLF